MANIITIFFTLFLGMSNPSENIKVDTTQEEVSTYYLIRHAEKDRSDSSNQNPDLNEDGLNRAEKWAEVFKDIEFDAVYSTDYNRTLQTAGPTAEMKKLEIMKYDPRKLFDENFAENTKGKTVLVVGHSNTTPQFANMILGENKYQDLDDSENGAVFIVQKFSDGSTTSKVLYIN